MWFKNNPLATAEIEAVPINSSPAPQLQEPTDEYRRLARKLGLAVITEPIATLEDVLRDESIHIYRMEDVNSYMRKRTPSGMGWGWKPCRRLDEQRSRGFITFRTGVYYDSGFLEDVYDKPIPFPVLLTLDKIEDATRNRGIQAAFFVSDYAARVPDPFLMVTVPMRKLSQWQEASGGNRLWTANPEPDCFVVERWDEPSFRER